MLEKHVGKIFLSLNEDYIAERIDLDTLMEYFRLIKHGLNRVED